MKPDRQSATNYMGRLALALAASGSLAMVARACAYADNGMSGALPLSTEAWITSICNLSLLGASLGLVSIALGANLRSPHAIAAIPVAIISFAAVTLSRPFMDGMGWYDNYLGQNRRSKCLADFTAVGEAMRMYAQDWDGRLPPADRWNDCLPQTLRGKYGDALCCVMERHEIRPSYAMNRAAVQRTSTEIEKVPNMPILFESVPGSNLVGGAELLPDRPRHGAGYVVLSFDGGAEEISEAELRSRLAIRNH